MSNKRKLHGLALVALCTALWACQDGGRPDSEKTGGSDQAERQLPPAQPEPLFVEQAQKTGLIFHHYSGATGKYHMPEILGSGVALIDFDNDGDQDVFLVQGSDIDRDADTKQGLSHGHIHDQPRGHRLYANQLAQSGQLEFTDATAAAGLEDEFYGMGVAVSDYDNDGDADLYVLGYEDNAFYKNLGGRFEKVPGAAGAQDTRWSSSASFCDINNDQWPDLYVANYVFYRPARKVICRDTLSQEDYCSPDSYSPAPDGAFINNRDGTFSEASQLWGIDKVASAGLGVLCRDFDKDGLQDLYVANDSMANHLWMNERGQRLVDKAEILGAALNMNGLTEGSMGVAAGDFDFDDDDDLFMTHWNNETNTIYRNDQALGFMDITTQVNLASPSLAHTGFGTDWLDIDNDGDLDIFVTNGAVQRYLDSTGRTNMDYGQKDQVFLNSGVGRFSDVSQTAFAGDLSMETGRGAAFGDIDNDGDIDVVVTNKDGPARLYLNESGQKQHWLGLQLTGVSANADAIGAVVNLTLTDGRTVRRVVRRDGSYQSASDPRIVIGLDAADTVQSVDISWPDGSQQQVMGLAPDRYHRVRQPE